MCSIKMKLFSTDISNRNLIITFVDIGFLEIEFKVGLSPFQKAVYLLQ